MNEKRVEEFAYHLLTKLSAFLCYHNKAHTENVVAAALYLCKEEKISEEEMSLIKAAALLHDTGFSMQPDGQNHEEESCRIAQKILMQSDYNNQQIETIYKLIMATRLPQSPHTFGEEILCDADLFYLGTDQYQVLSYLLYQELKAQHKIENEQQWNEKQIQFLSSHRYFTAAARREQERSKALHLEAIIKAQQTTT